MEFFSEFRHGRIGLTLAGVTGRIVADLTCGLEPPVDIAPLRADRFPRQKNLLAA